MESVPFEELLTTSNAAKICGVTRFTIRNWILENRLKAFKTGGHHHRVLRSDLLRFMEKAGIRPAAPVFCWEYEQLAKTGGHDCGKCLVFKERSNRCFLTIREFGSEKVRCGRDCADCEYMKATFTKEKAAMIRLSGKNASRPPQAKPSGSKVLENGFYKSGRYLAGLKNLFSGKK